MSKNLEQAIGCWTVNREYNSLPKMGSSILLSANDCRRSTQAGDAERLCEDLRVLRSRLMAMLETTDHAMRRMAQILQTNEVDMRDGTAKRALTTLVATMPLHMSRKVVSRR